MLMRITLLLVFATGSLASGPPVSTLLIAAPNGGLWGVETDPQDPSKLYMAPWLGYPQRGFYYGAVSEDPVGPPGKLLLEIVNEFGDFHGLAFGDVCGVENLEILLERVFLVDEENPHLSGCGEDCRWSGFYMYDGDIYFLLAGQHGGHADQLEVKVELRRLQGCDDLLPITDDSQVRQYGDHALFPLLHCSTHIAAIASLSPEQNVRVGKYMTRTLMFGDDGDRNKPRRRVGEEKDDAFYFLTSTSDFAGAGFVTQTRLNRVGSAGHVVLDEVTTDDMEYEDWETRTRGGVVSCRHGNSHFLAYGLGTDLRYRTGDGPWRQTNICGGSTNVDGITTTDCRALYIGCSSSTDSSGNQPVVYFTWSAAEVSKQPVTSLPSMPFPVQARAILATRTHMSKQACEVKELLRRHL